MQYQGVCVLTRGDKIIYLCGIELFYFTFSESLQSLFLLFQLSGTLLAIDINKGRLRILKETAELHQVDDVISTIHADLRNFAVNFIPKPKHEVFLAQYSNMCNFSLIFVFLLLYLGQ